MGELYFAQDVHGQFQCYQPAANTHVTSFMSKFDIPIIEMLVKVESMVTGPEPWVRLALGMNMGSIEDILI